ncbi:PQQ-binding-like beta-propeller repeat protein [Bradyrhizobium oligotrophicum S58]
MIGQPLSDLKRDNALLWSVDIGRMHSRNNIVVRDNHAFVSSSGKRWNAKDEKDGVYCIDLNLGTIVWFTQTNSDANEVTVLQDVVLVGTDEGRAFALDVKNGKLLRTFDATAAIYTRAVELERADHKTGVLVSYAGEIIEYDVDLNEFSLLATLPFPVRANPVRIEKDTFIIGSETGSITLVKFDGKNTNWKTVFQLTPYKSSGTLDHHLKIKGISSLVVRGDRVVVSYSRDTYDRRPPMVCFSLSTGRKVWDAGRIPAASKTDISEFGNSRVTPVLYGDLVISTFAYNDAVHAFSLSSGKWLWRQRLDASYFQNWSSPVEHRGFLYVARINGVLTVMNISTRKILSSYSVEHLRSVE